MLKIEIWEENKILRKKSEEIKKIDFKKYLKFGKQMLKYIKDPKNKGVWLAAPQAGENIRLIAVCLPKDWEDEHYPCYIMYNPEILESSDTTETMEEWCLSLPWIYDEVTRAKKIKIKYFDEKFKEKILFLDYPSSAIVQHEIDHLDGILFTDRIEKKKNLPFF